MDKAKYLNIFNAFNNVPLEDFLKGIFKGLSANQRRQLVLQDVSYHRYSDNVVTLEAWINMVPAESNRWIWAQVEMDAATGSIQEYYYTRDHYGKQALPSLQACIRYYKDTK